jgi:glycine cleavage system H protein
MSEIPAELKYAKSHEWVRLQGGVATVGITDHAQHELTDLVFVELPALGRVLKAGESCAVVDSVKTTSDIYAPVAGEVIAVNQEIVANPALVNAEPYQRGWFFQVRLSEPSGVEALLDTAAYRALIGS